jgi:hypothetical protein
MILGNMECIIEIQNKKLKLNAMNLNETIEKELAYSQNDE